MAFKILYNFFFLFLCTSILVCVWNTRKCAIQCLAEIMVVPCTIHGTRKYFFQKNNFKTRSYDIIHIFNNYFVTVFSVFSNKWYSNRPLLTLKNNKEARGKRKIWKCDKEVEHMIYFGKTKTKDVIILFS